MQKRKSFILHFDSLDVLQELSKEQIADLFIAIKDYNLGKEIKLTGLMKAVFIPFKNQFDRDSEEYKNTCERNRNNGLKGGRPKKPKETQKTQSVISKPKKADNDNDNDNKNNIKEQLENIIIHRNKVFKEKRQVTKDLEIAYKNLRKKYTYEEFKKGYSVYCGKKVKEDKQYWLSPIGFMTQKNGFISYL